QRQCPFAPGCLPEPLAVLFWSGLPAFSGAVSEEPAAAPSGSAATGLPRSSRRYGSSLDGGRELVEESSPARLANKRANSCNRQANSSSCSRDIPARSERLISFSSGANRRGTSSVESHSRQSASPLTTIRPRPSPPHPIDLRGDVNGYHPRAESPLVGTRGNNRRRTSEFPE